MVVLAFSAASSLLMNEPIDEERLSELACEKIEHEVADPRLVVDDLEEGLANGSEVEQLEEAEEGEEAGGEAALSPIARGDGRAPRREGVTPRVMVLPDDEVVDALSD